LYALTVGIFTDVLRLIETHRPQTIFHVGAAGM
jgi:hypothetical protein